jgi:hypothetical protein
MSKNRNRAKLNKAHNQKEYKAILINLLYPPYWDDGISFYPEYRAGYKNPQKRLTKIEIRQYKTWKYNRKTQYKF